MNLRSLAAFAAVFLLAGCASHAVVSDINDSSVKVQANSVATMGDVTREANRGCSQYGKSASPMSSQCLNNYCTMKEYLFVCK